MICWVESVDPVADLCLANQIYSVLLNASESKEITEVFHEDGEKRTRRCKTFKFSEIPIEDREAGRFVLASTRHHRARLLKYYPRPPCAHSFVKSRMLCPLQTDFSLFQQIFFILVCIQAGNPRLPPRVLASGPKPCGGKNIDDAGRLIMRSNKKKGLRSRNR